MSASAAALPREGEVQAKIRKVRAFGRNARAVCAALFWLALVGIVILPLIAVITRTGTDVGAVVPANVPRPDGDGGTYDVLQALLSPLQLILAVFVIMGVVIGVWLAALRQLHRLFGNLAAGAIYTPENVRRVRNVGLYAKDHADALQRDAELTI